MPLFGSPNFEKMKAKSDIRGLWKLMVDNQGDLRTQASKTLEEIGVPAVIPLLDLAKVHGLKAEERDLAVGVIRAIGTAAVEPLLAILKGEDEDQRFIAVHALGEIGDSRALEPFLDLLKAEKFSFSQVAAVSYLGKFLGARAQGPILDFMNKCKKPFSLLAADSVSAALGDIGDEQSLDLLVALTQYRFKNEAKSSDRDFAFSFHSKH